MKTIVYIDGFNLYYGCVKGTASKWLDLEQLCDTMLPNDQVLEVKYFTALVKPRPSNTTSPQNQQVFPTGARHTASRQCLPRSFHPKPGPHAAGQADELAAHRTRGQDRG